MTENNIVVLTVDIPSHNLRIGDIGTIVMVHKNASAFEVEFVKFSGETISIETLERSHIRQVGNDEIPHVRLIESHKYSSSGIS